MLDRIDLAELDEACPRHRMYGFTGRIRDKMQNRPQTDVDSSMVIHNFTFGGPDQPLLSLFRAR
jgi:hypothetical protein